jgi:ATP-binding cassette subfamily F protein 2
MQGEQQTLTEWPPLSPQHLDLEGIDALADGIKQFKGGMVLVSHDFRLLQQVAEEIWVCDKGKISKWPGDIISYKNHLKKNMKKYVPLSL